MEEIGEGVGWVWGLGGAEGGGEEGEGEEEGGEGVHGCWRC